MGIYKTPGDKWTVKRRGRDGRWWSITVADYTAAKKHDAEMALAFDRGEAWQHPRALAAAQQRARVSLRSVILAFIAERAPHLEVKTLQRYGRELEWFATFAEAQGKGEVRDLSRGLLTAFLGDLQRPTRSPRLQPATAAKITKTARIFWEWAHDHTDEHPEWGAVPQPRKVELPAAPVAARPAPTWEDMDDMLSALDDRPTPVEWARRLAWLQRAIGARVSEAVQTRWADLDLDHGTLTLRASTTKARAGGRVVPIPTWLRDAMKTWARDGEFATYICGETGRRTAGTSRGARVFSTAWRDAGVSPAIWEGRGTHALRAGVQTGLTALGWQADAVRLLVGHQLDELRRRYIDPTIAFDLRGMVEAIPAPGVEATTRGPALRGQPI